MYMRYRYIIECKVLGIAHEQTVKTSKAKDLQGQRTEWINFGGDAGRFGVQKHTRSNNEKQERGIYKLFQENIWSLRIIVLTYFRALTIAVIFWD